MTNGIRVWKQLEAAPIPSKPLQQVPILIVGAGLVGLSMALDLARKGRKVLVISKLDFIPDGSKAICFSKRSLDIWSRLGVGKKMVDRGVVWNIGKVFFGEEKEPIYEFDILRSQNQKNPAFVNLQQYYAEEYLHSAVSAEKNVDLRLGHEVISCSEYDDRVIVDVRTDEGSYRVEAEWLIACDGNKSSVRDLMNLELEGRTFEDKFLIADVRFKETRPSERWFWFDPPFNPNRSALLHKQPDDVWRIDFHLGENVDRAVASLDENVEPLVRAFLGEGIEFEKEWYSVYSFQCLRMGKFVHGRVIFAGDSAHLVSPFGARGCNGGLADIDNLGWKLDLVLKGEADQALIDTYDYEATVTADENILKSARSTDFITPRSTVNRAFRDAVLELAKEFEFARPFVNSGRLSTAVSYPASPLNTPDSDKWEGGASPGSVMLDSSLGSGWLLDELGDQFVLLRNGGNAAIEGVKTLDISELGNATIAIERLAIPVGGAYLVRPDQYVAARWLAPNQAQLDMAFIRARGGMLHAA